MSIMRSISPYQLWKFLLEGNQKDISCMDGNRKYVDCRLGVFLASHGITLKGVVITNDIETYANIDDVHYLKAHVIMEDSNGDEIMMDLKPFYTGDDDEWALLMEDKTVDDIDIRFTMEVYKTEPLWIAVMEKGRRTQITGDIMEWEMMFRMDSEIARGMRHEYAGITSDELFDLKAEALDPDYDVNDSPYNNWRNY